MDFLDSISSQDIINLLCKQDTEQRIKTFEKLVELCSILPRLAKIEGATMYYFPVTVEGKKTHVGVHFGQANIVGFYKEYVDDEGYPVEYKVEVHHSYHIFERFLHMSQKEFNNFHCQMIVDIAERLDSKGLD